MKKQQPTIEGTPFNQWLRHSRGMSGLSMSGLAEKLDVSLNTIKNYENGDSIPPSRGEVKFLEDIVEEVRIIASKAAIDYAERNLR